MPPSLLPAIRVKINRKHDAVYQESIPTTGMSSVSMYTHPNDANHKSEHLHVKEDFGNGEPGINFWGMVTALLGDEDGLHKKARDVIDLLKKSEHWDTIKAHIDQYNGNPHIEEALYEPFQNMGNLLFDFAKLPFRFVDTHAKKVRNDDPTMGDPFRKPDICMIWPTPKNRKINSRTKIGTPPNRVYWSQKSSRNATADPVQVAQIGHKRLKLDNMDMDHPNSGGPVMNSAWDQAATLPNRSQQHTCAVDAKRPTLDNSSLMDLDDPNSGGPAMNSVPDQAAMLSNRSQRHTRAAGSGRANHIPSERHFSNISYGKSHLSKGNGYSKNERLTDQAQLAAYAMEVFSARGLKRHVLGFFIEGTEMELWYFNRSGSFGTKRISFGSNFEVLFVLLLMLGHATPGDLGLEPCIAPPLRGMPRRATSSSRPVTRLSLTGCEASSDFLLCANGARIKVDGATYVIDGEKLNKGRCFKGRGTMVWNVDEYRDGNAVTPKDGLVLKLSWQLVARTSEVKFLRDLKKSGVQLIPDMYKSVDFDQLSWGPHGKIQQLLGNSLEFDDRVLRAIVLRPRLQPITTLRFSRLLSAFVSLVDTHHQVFEDAGLLHRDVHPENLMFWECGNKGCYNEKLCSHREGEGFKPYLIDFDSAAQVGDRSPGHDPTHRTVITPFLAIELANDPPPPAQYRHDLESFFWSFWWIMTHYEERGGQVVYKELAADEKTDYQDWHVGTWDQIYRRKLGFLGSETFDKVPFSIGLEDCQPKLRCLSILFDELYTAVRKLEDKSPSEDRQERQARSNPVADNIISYRTFRECLTGAANSAGLLK